LLMTWTFGAPSSAAAVRSVPRIQTQSFSFIVQAQRSFWTKPPAGTGIRAESPWNPVSWPASLLGLRV
jgi:hypothetical protein